MNILLKIEQIKKLIKKPNRYHHLCYAGTSIVIFNFWSENPSEKCNICECKNYKDLCKGISKGKMELSDRDEIYNKAINDVLNLFKK